MKKVGIFLLIAMAIGAVIFFGYVPGNVDRSMNTVTRTVKNTSSSSNASIPFVADLHCDMLLWDRDFLQDHDFGHVDLPRMKRANVAFQVFTIVSKTPKGINIEHNDASTDQITLLSLAQLRPVNTWFSLKARALNQCANLHDFAADSKGSFRVVTNQQDLQKFIEDRSSNSQLTAGMLGLEGAHCLEGDLNSLADFYRAGVRYIGLTHFFDNEWGGSAHGVEKGGLTPLGRKLVRKMDSLHIMVDLAHASRKTIDDILAVTKGPILVSHTGVKGVCNNQRNLTDEHLLEIGRRQGLVGIGLWETAVCGTDAAATARSIRYVADKIGVDKVALGSDFDGAIQAHFDVTGLPLIADALKSEGFNEQEIALIMGGNIRDFLLRNLPTQN
ncbi:MAG: dipeptidase [Cyclobacteriaceae bacterium]|nr:dipeptidase [Cyclobacteriaceae bacterium]